MLKRFHNQLEALGCTGKKILVAVSGGLDSVVLLDLLLMADCTVGVAHANFQLRGGESLDDEAFVRELAMQRKVPFHTSLFETNNDAIKMGVSVQMAARQLRYAWFDRIMDQEDYDFVATAHHLNDNLETVLLNFVRGTGLSGLQGIPIKNGRIVRPLLQFTRAEIKTYATDHRLTWREDSSNAKNDYSRNFIRHHIVPSLKELNPSLEETFARNTERLQASHELARHELERLRQTYVLQQGRQVKISKSITGLFKHPAPVLLELIKEYDFNLDQSMEIVLALHGQPGKQFLSPTHRLVIDREHLIICTHQDEWKEVLIEEGQRHASLGHWVLEMENSTKAEVQSNNLQAILPGDKLHFPLLWRKWKHGDFFFPMGMDHKKKLSDFLVDSKISLTEKEAVTVLESAGEIVWVVGYRIDNRFKIIEEAKKVVVFKLKTNSQDKL